MNFAEAVALARSVGYTEMLPVQTAAAGIRRSDISAAAPDKNIFALAGLVLALGTLALYSPITGYPFINFDDDQYVSANPARHGRA